MSKAPIKVIYSPPERTILVTGGAGFIGSAVCRLLVSDGSVRVINLDRLTHAAPPAALTTVDSAANYRFIQGDICDRELVAHILRDERVDAIMHLATASDVDPSIAGPAFIETNITGTFHLLEMALDHWRSLLPDRRERFRFIHISTDQVFGDLPFYRSRFDEQSAYRPSSPYAATKAASDHLVRAWHRSFGVPVIVSTCGNNYGPFQNPAKLIPLTIRNALAGLPLPVHGTGATVRDWLHVDDHAMALRSVLDHGQIGETYLIGGREEHSNIAVVAMICDLIDLIEPRPDGRKRRSFITFTVNRAGQDRRYAIDPRRIEQTLGWRPRVKFRDGLIETIDWYRANDRTDHPARTPISRSGNPR